MILLFSPQMSSYIKQNSAIPGNYKKLDDPKKKKKVSTVTDSLLYSVIASQIP